MRVVCGESEALPLGMAKALAYYRYRVFVQMLGWKLFAPGSLEVDQFDTRETIYVVALDDSDDIVGCCRLLPTSAPYLIEEVFPQLLNGMAIPHSEEIWELSRFASVDLKNSAVPRTGRFSPSGTRALIEAALDCAASRGVERLISGSPLGVPRLLRKLGIKAYEAALPVLVDQRPLVAVWIEVPRYHRAMSQPGAVGLRSQERR